MEEERLHEKSYDKDINTMSIVAQNNVPHFQFKYLIQDSKYGHDHHMLSLKGANR